MVAQVGAAFLTDTRFPAHNYKPDPVLLTQNSEGRQERWGKVGGKNQPNKKQNNNDTPQITGGKEKKSFFFFSFCSP